MIIKRDEFFKIFGKGFGAGSVGQKYADRDDRRVILALAQYHKPKTVVEIGVNEGLTARMLLAEVPSIEEYVGVDLPEGGVPRLESQAPEVPEEPGSLVADNSAFRVIRVDSADLVPEDLPAADLIYIDGGHEYETVKHDTELARAICKPGGVVIWHDYIHHPGVGVPRLIDEINLEEGNHITLVSGTRVCFTIRAAEEKAEAAEPVAEEKPKKAPRKRTRKPAAKKAAAKKAPAKRKRTTKKK